MKNENTRLSIYKNYKPRTEFNPSATPTYPRCSDLPLAGINFSAGYTGHTKRKAIEKSAK